jgi:hypothetical protein
MKTSYIEQHDYITVGVIDPAGVRLSLTQARWRGKASCSIKPAAEQTESAAVVRAEFKAQKVLKLFNAGPTKTTPGKWMLATKQAGEDAKTMAEFFELLPKRLAAIDVPALV